VRLVAFLWGLQFSFLNPAIALLLVSVFGASTGQVAGVLAIYNGAGLLTSWVIPRSADRRGDYVRPMMGCAIFTIALSVTLLFAHALLLAVVGLVLLGAPAAVGAPLLFGYIRHSGARPGEVVRSRAMFSAAWVAGPPLASAIISGAGGRALVLGIGVIGALNLTAISTLLRRSPEQPGGPAVLDTSHRTLVPRSTVALLVAAFAALQAAVMTAVSITTLFVTKNLHLPPVWGGIALGVAAGLEVPTLLLLGRRKRRAADLSVLSLACIVGIAYYISMSLAANATMVIAAQLLNASFYGVVAGVGITLFQSIIAGPGAGAGLLSNAQGAGALLAGPIVGIGSVFPGGLRAVYLACAIVTCLGLVLVRIVSYQLVPQRYEANPEESSQSRRMLVQVS
jgi:SET family sugar efflux transporter-like MFS transporter